MGKIYLNILNIYLKNLAMVLNLNNRIISVHIVIEYIGMIYFSKNKLEMVLRSSISHIRNTIVKYYRHS